MKIREGKGRSDVGIEVKIKKKLACLFSLSFHSFKLLYNLQNFSTPHIMIPTAADRKPNPGK